MQLSVEGMQYGESRRKGSPRFLIFRRQEMESFRYQCEFRPGSRSEGISFKGVGDVYCDRFRAGEIHFVFHNAPEIGRPNDRSLEVSCSASGGREPDALRADHNIVFAPGQGSSCLRIPRPAEKGPPFRRFFAGEEGGLSDEGGHKVVRRF